MSNKIITHTDTRYHDDTLNKKCALCAEPCYFAKSHVCDVCKEPTCNAGGRFYHTCCREQDGKCAIGTCGLGVKMFLKNMIRQIPVNHTCVRCRTVSTITLSESHDIRVTVRLGKTYYDVVVFNSRNEPEYGVLLYDSDNPEHTRSFKIRARLTNEMMVLKMHLTADNLCQNRDAFIAESLCRCCESKMEINKEVDIQDTAMKKKIQLYDWYACDKPSELQDESDSSEHENRFQPMSYVIYMFGVTSCGKNVTTKVRNFEPFFWIHLCASNETPWTHTCTLQLLEYFRSSLPRYMRDELIIPQNASPQSVLYKKYAFRNYQWNRRKNFIKLSFKSERALKRVYGLLKDYKAQTWKEITVPNTEIKRRTFPVYEKNIPPILRFIHMKEIKPSGWVEVVIQDRHNDSIYACNWDVDWHNVNPVNDSSIGPLHIASFDIEADSSHGDFPLAIKNYSKLASEIFELKKAHNKSNRGVLVPALISRWLHCAFRNYINGTYDEHLMGSVHNVFTKSGEAPTSHEISLLSDEVYLLLVDEKIASKKLKEQIDMLTKLFDKCLPRLTGDKVVQIGTVSHRIGQEKTTTRRHIVTLGGCAELDGIEVVQCSTVPQLISAWMKHLRQLQPNIITGWNIFGFDFKFIWDCALEHNCIDDLAKFSPLKELNMDLGKQVLASSALGTNLMYYPAVTLCEFSTTDSGGVQKKKKLYSNGPPGIVLFDLMKVFQKDTNLSSYKLDDVSTEFINGKIKEIVYLEKDVLVLKTADTFSLQVGQYIIIYESSIVGKVILGSKNKIIALDENSQITIEISDADSNSDLIELPQNPKSHYWAVGKDDVSHTDIFEMQRGTDEERARIAKYCIQDSELCLNLITRRKITPNNIGMSNVCLVPFSYLFLRGQMIKTLSLVSSECSKENYLIPELPRASEDGPSETYEGAIVLEPTPAIHLDNPISVLDYASLYPSSMIGANISHDTIVVEEKYQGELGGELLKKKGLDYVDVTYDNYITEMVGKTPKKRINETQPQVTCRYIQAPRVDGKTDNTKLGILPRILQKLLKARKDTKKKMAQETDGFQKSVLDGLQLAYKVTANSLYGGMGAATSALYYKDIAASTTAVGREYLHKAEQYVKELYPEAEVIYGDTDSIFVNFKPCGEDGEMLTGVNAIQASVDMALAVQDGIKAKIVDGKPFMVEPHKLEYEKTFYPFVLLRKKGYIGNKYDEDWTARGGHLHDFKQTSMGVVTKRRDNAPIVKYIYDGVIRRIFHDRDIQSSILFLKETLTEVLDGKFEMDPYFIITKSLRAQYAFPDRVVHKVLADRIGERDPGNRPQSNDRIPYVYIESEESVKLQGERVEHPDYIRANGLKLDYSFYIKNQIQRPVCQIFALSLEALRPHGYSLPPCYFEEMTRQLNLSGKSNVREKVMDKKMNEVFNILFQPYVGGKLLPSSIAASSNSRTVRDIQQDLVAAGLKKSGKKGDLEDRLAAYVVAQKTMEFIKNKSL